MTKATTGIVLLAAGSSSRLGKPKQLLPFGDGTLLEHALGQLQALPGTATMVVLGARAELLLPVVQSLDVAVQVNEAWETGMASSIRCGLRALLQDHPQMTGCLLTVCDQPMISTLFLQSLINLQDGEAGRIVASSYSGTLGTPVLFSRRYFAELLQLSGEAGARHLLKQYSENVVAADFPAGAIDIDTAADYEQLLQQTPE